MLQTHVEHLSRPVVGVARREAHLVDLEPACGRSNGGCSVVDLGHVDVDRAPVVSLQVELSVQSNGSQLTAYTDSLVRARTVAGLLVHLDRDGVTG